MQYEEDDMLMLSGIQHFRFCPRQWALIHIEQQWDDNRLTIEGQILHKHVDDPFYRQKCGDQITLRAVNIASRELDSWSEENRNAEYPLLLIDGSGGGNMNNIPSSFWVKSGAYMRLKNVSVGYSLPKNILGKSGLSNVRFYLSGQNLLTIAKGYKGYDPEGDVSSYYPVTQVYTFGVDIKF